MLTLLQATQVARHSQGQVECIFTPLILTDIFNPVNKMLCCFLSAIEKYERNKKYGKQALPDTGEISRSSGLR